MVPDLGPIAPIVSRIERAKKHILDLEQAFSAFVDKESAYAARFEDDAKAGERRYYLATAKNLPLDLALITGDAVHNLRSALDHLAYLLVNVGTHGTGPSSHVYFPIFENASKYKAGLSGKVKGMRQDAIDAISATEPYGGGNGDAFYQLHCLNNIDKHRLLLTVWANFQSHTLLPSQRAHAERIYLGSHPGGTPPDLRDVFIAPTVKRFPLKQGDIILTVPFAEVENNLQIRLDIAFGEPKVLQGKSVFETLHDLMDRIHDLVLRFDRLGLCK